MDVIPGQYVGWRIKITDNLKNFITNWWMGANSRPISNETAQYQQNDEDVVRFFERDQFKNFVGVVGEWVYFVQGIINVRANSNVHYQLAGNNPYWTGGIMFDFVGLYRLPLSWSVKRVILMAWLTEGHSFNKLSREMIENIISFV